MQVSISKLHLDDACEGSYLYRQYQTAIPEALRLKDRTRPNQLGTWAGQAALTMHKL